MPLPEPVDVFLICRMCFLQRASWAWLCTGVRRNPVGQKLTPRLTAFPARSRLNEIDYGFEDTFGCFEKTAVNPYFVGREADDDSAILSQSDTVMPVESKPDKDSP